MNVLIFSQCEKFRINIIPHNQRMNKETLSEFIEPSTQLV